MWEIDNKGIFGVVYNPRTKKIQMQKHTFPFNFKNLVKGSMPNLIACSNDKVDDLKKSWNAWSAEDRGGVDLCVKNLYFAYKKYLQLDTAFQSSTESLELAKDVQQFQKDFLNTFNDVNLGNQKTQTVNVGWHTIDVNDIDPLDLSTLAQKIANEKNPIDGVEFKGKIYRIFDNKDNHTLELQVFGGESNAPIKPQTNTQIVRTFIKMVKMINASGLTDFVNGNFYQVKDVMYFDGKKYYLIEDNNGIAHHIANDRLKELTVYIEPPKISPETALS